MKKGRWGCGGQREKRLMLPEQNSAEPRYENKWVSNRAFPTAQAKAGRQNKESALREQCQLPGTGERV